VDHTKSHLLWYSFNVQGRILFDEELTNVGAGKGRLNYYNKYSRQVSAVDMHTHCYIMNTDNHTVKSKSN